MRISAVESISYPIVPMAAPRLNRNSRWNPEKQALIARYHAFRDEVRLRRVVLPERPHMTFLIPVPKCGEDRIGTPHRQKPDGDNYAKALLDAVYGDDSHVWDFRATKFWAAEGAIIVRALPEEIGG